MLIATGARSTSTTVPMFTGLPEVSCALALMVSDPSAHRDVCGRNRSLPCAVRQYRCGITLAVDAHGDGATRRRSVLVPEITGFCACSIMLMTSSPATVSMRRPGSSASMVTSGKTIRYCRARSSRWPTRSGRRCRARLTDSGLTAGSGEIVLYGSRVCLPAEDNRDGITRCRV